MTDRTSANPPHALVVDDDALILMDAIGILEDAGFQVFEATNVDQALKVLAQHHEDVQLLFTDVQMPGGQSGFDLARTTAERWPHIAIVVASGCQIALKISPPFASKVSPFADVFGCG